MSRFSTLMIQNLLTVLVQNVETLVISVRQMGSCPEPAYTGHQDVRYDVCRWDSECTNPTDKCCRNLRNAMVCTNQVYSTSMSTKVVVTSRVSGQGNKIGAVFPSFSLCVCLSALTAEPFDLSP